MSALITWESDSGDTSDVQFDVVFSETHEDIATITDHPVESGVNISDHVRQEPKRLSIEGYVSDKPLISNPGVADEFDYQSLPLDIPEGPNRLPITPGAITQAAVNGISSLFSDALPDHFTGLASKGSFKPRSLEIWQKLDSDAWENARICTIVTKLRVYENMVVERVSAPRQVSDGSGLTIQVDFRQIRIVKSETVSAPEPAEARGQLTKALGSKSPLKEDEDKAAKKKSLALQLIQGSGIPLPSFLQ